MKQGVGFLEAGSPLGSSPRVSSEWMLRSAASRVGRVAFGPAFFRASTNSCASVHPKTENESLAWSGAVLSIQSWYRATPGLLRSSLLKYSAEPSSENTLVGLPEARSL